jgi:hypothetical protein
VANVSVTHNKERKGNVSIYNLRQQPEIEKPKERKKEAKKNC